MNLISRTSGDLQLGLGASVSLYIIWGFISTEKVLGPGCLLFVCLCSPFITPKLTDIRPRAITRTHPALSGNPPPPPRAHLMCPAASIDSTRAHGRGGALVDWLGGILIVALKAAVAMPRAASLLLLTLVCLLCVAVGMATAHLLEGAWRANLTKLPGCAHSRPTCKN